MNGLKKNNPVRLQKYLASCINLSRRGCEALIAEGRVAVNGERITAPGVKVSREDRITVDGRPAVPQERYYYMLNKPRGYLSSNYDPHHTLFARDLIDVPAQKMLFHVGRLDLQSTGLMIFTNDGEFAQKIQHPSFGVEKEYFVRTAEKFLQKDLKKSLKGVQLSDGIVYNIKRYTPVSDREVRLVLTEGKNREIRNLFAYFGYTVDVLHRIRIGSVELGDLKPGRYREIEGDVVQEILHHVGKG